ncbi:hypothetical protein ABID08_003264 [Rhizobium binae]|uniref:Uncharacterized protein n=1 Tax=Rhizobium binae TaxID=1138190 RepID=A0ABV2MKG9_9HYPH|nr:hypothetical protein [Rhizobium binae]MBX4991415.1 hypothetical protein [Rhizobium binae]NKL48522.1 hypothetical protein [Rhizobium leguminosarum bv. viciae]QSY81561.1 hypothetical protein J2J99_18185 [Rhizobium binae]
MTNFVLCHREMPVLGGLLQRHINWLRTCGVPMPAIVQPELVRLAHGYRGSDGLFDPDESGPAWFAFAEVGDVIFWRPEDELARWTGRAFALGEQAVDNAGTYSLGHCLHVYRSPLHWLKAGRDGIVVIDWERAFDELRHCPRVAVDENLLSVYSRHMRPRRLPEVYVLPERRGVAS